jgi:ferredoxin
MFVQIDTARCAGHGQCHYTAPELFDVDAEGFGVVTVTGPLPESLAGAAEAGVSACPERAVILSDAPA